jgi:heme-degrading monooxygenase HmoA
MYGTVARMRVKVGSEDQFMTLMSQYSRLKVPGYQGTFAYRMDANPREVFLAVVFESKDAYDRNADSPEQDARFREMVALLDGDPEWHDGEIMADATIVSA